MNVTRHIFHQDLAATGAYFAVKRGVLYQDATTTEDATIEYDGVEIRRPAMVEYYETVLAPHVRTWAEATLCATLWVLRERLGIEAVWFHTFEGSRLKGDCDPPRSLYTDLPRKFCFGKTREAPAFLHWKDSPVLKHSLGPGAKNPVDWYRLPLSTPATSRALRSE